jgi:sulfofructose kinase
MRVSIVRLGGAATFWGRVGDDPLGRRIIDDLAAEGVNVDDVRRIGRCRSPSTAVLIDDVGERLVCTYDPKLDPDRSWRWRWLKAMTSPAPPVSPM